MKNRKFDYYSKVFMRDVKDLQEEFLAASVIKTSLSVSVRPVQLKNHFPIM